jgi:Tfp pilus assembly protein PilO
MTETILTILLTAFAVLASRYFAIAAERLKTIDNLQETIENLKQELREWQNKALPTPLGFETISRKQSNTLVKTGDSIVPITPTRSELIKRRAESGHFKASPVNTALQEKALLIKENGNHTDTQ